MKKAGRKKVYFYPTVKLSSKKIEEICETLFQKGIVVIPKFGRFELRNVKARKTFHNFSKAVITIKAHKRVNFEPCNCIKDKCKK